MTGVLENGIGASTAYGYDVQGNLISVEQGSQLRSFGYTSLGRLSSAINPESATTSYGYDGNGNLTSKTDARSITTTMAYDGLNRMTSKTYSDGTPSVSYTYDTNETIPSASAANFIVGHLAQVSTTLAGTAYVNTYQYDAVGRATASMQSIGTSNYPFLYTYLPAGMQTETYPSGRVVTNQFDAAGRILNVADSSVTYASNVTYAPQGAVASFQMGNNVTETTSFNSRLQPWQIQAGSLLTLTYGYGTSADNGNVYSAGISRNGSTWIQTYNYDGANRLTGAWETGPGTAWSETYGYDGYGNQWLSGYSGLWTGAVTSETPQSSSWYDTSTNRISNGGSWTYDSAGNIKTMGGMSRSFSYDPEERQTQAVVNGTTENYVYDGHGGGGGRSSGGHVFSGGGHAIAGGGHVYSGRSGFSGARGYGAPVYRGGHYRDDGYYRGGRYYGGGLGLGFYGGYPYGYAYGPAYGYAPAPACAPAYDAYGNLISCGNLQPYAVQPQYAPQTQYAPQPQYAPEQQYGPQQYAPQEPSASQPQYAPQQPSYYGPNQ